jgi:LPXTG-site transpeptidase (sortase) family protein
VLAVASLLVATAVAVALVARDPSAPHVRAEGRIHPATTSTTTAPAVTYPTATTVPPARPLRALHVPSIGVDAPVVPVGVKPGTDELDVPQLDTVGWYALGPSPGQDGSAVLAGHVDGQGREAVFFRLGRVAVGDPVQVDFADGTTSTFRVVGRQQVPKTQLPPDLFSRAGPPRLTLITCGGAFNSSTRHYVDNVVVVAEPVP